MRRALNPRMLNVFFVEKFSEGDRDLQLDAMRKVMRFTSKEDADVIYCASISFMRQAQVAHYETHKPLVVYCWDYYKWAHDGVRTGHNTWEWPQYAAFLKEASLVLVPSSSQQRRLRELLGIESVVVKTGIRRWTDTYPDLAPTDEGFILDPLRYYPEETATWCVKAAKELGIPMIHSEHQYTDEEFGKLVASCTFLTCGVQEASTGTLTVSEALWFGKVALLSDSPYMGGRDYLGDHAFYFKADDYEDCKAQLKKMWEGRPTVPIEKARAYFTEQFSFDQMAENLVAAMRSVLK